MSHLIKRIGVVVVILAFFVQTAGAGSLAPLLFRDTGSSLRGMATGVEEAPLTQEMKDALRKEDAAWMRFREKTKFAGPFPMNPEDVSYYSEGRLPYSPGSKPSPGGYNIKGRLKDLNRSSIIAVAPLNFSEPDLREVAQALQGVIMNYRGFIGGTEGITEDVVQVAELNMRNAQNLINIIDTTLQAERMPKMEETVTLILDETALPMSQIAVAQKIGEIGVIGDRLGVQIVLSTPDDIEALSNREYNTSNAIVIAGVDNVEVFRSIGARTIAINDVTEEQFLPLTSLAIFAKAMLAIDKRSLDGSPLMSTIVSIYKSLAGQEGVLTNEDLRAFVEDPINNPIILRLPTPRIAYRSGELETLHLRAKQALEAA